MPKNIMRRFRLSEISAVDLPAQRNAMARIMKRASDVVRVGEHTVRTKTPDGRDHHIEVDDDDPLLDTLEKERNMSSEKFNAKVNEIAERDRCGRVEAMKRAADQHPDLLAAHRSGPTVDEVAKAHAPEPAPEAVRKFRSLVDDIAESRKISKREAQRIAAERHPEEYQAYQLA